MFSHPNAVECLLHMTQNRHQGFILPTRIRFNAIVVSVKCWVKLLPHSQTSTLAVWESISNFIAHSLMDVITYPWLGLKSIHVSKRTTLPSGQNMAYTSTNQDLIFSYLVILWHFFISYVTKFLFWILGRQTPQNVSYILWEWKCVNRTINPCQISSPTNRFAAKDCDAWWRGYIVISRVQNVCLIRSIFIDGIGL